MSAAQLYGGTVTQTQTITRPQPNVLYGLTHDLDGNPVVREPKLLKVGIGCLKGPAIEVFLRDGKWTVRTGYERGKIKSFDCTDRQQAQHSYAALRKTAPDCPYPRKLNYFTFSRQAADGTMEPDWDAIEAHGDQPSEIDVVFFSDQPLDASYAMWGSSELKCKGDGLNAERVCTMAANDEERQLAEAARAAGSKYFPIIEGCYMRGCQYARETQQGQKTLAPMCKPHADLKFQLAKNLRVGGTAYFHTTGFRSISQLFSCLYRFRCLTGGGDPGRGFLVGIPFKFVLRQFRTNHNGQAGTAYGVALEFRAETIDALVKNMVEQGLKFLTAMLAPGRPAAVAASAGQRMLSAASIEEEPDVADADENEAATAAAIDQEFGADATGDLPVEEEPIEGDGSGSVAAAQDVATRKIADLKAKAGEPADPPEEEEPKGAEQTRATDPPAPRKPLALGRKS